MTDTTNKNHSSPTLFILFPAITMLLGWGLRGYIGGGPFGAMIPGAMVALSISMLLRLPVSVASIFVVFGVAGIGLGGEMTYGQTIGFLRNPDTMWWGALGLTVKGAVWGLMGGTILATGLIYNRLTKKTIIITFLLLLAGMLVGFKLINQPMIIYFSDPSKPRPESWGALLVGVVTVLIYLKNKLDPSGFRIITRFAFWGLIGGGLGFGLGGFWMVLGNHLPKEVLFKEWWKAMEFTFGLLFGAALGYAAWLNRKDIENEKAILSVKSDSTLRTWITEFLMTFLVGFLIFWLFAFWLDPVVDAAKGYGSFTMIGLTDLAKIFSNYAFFGLIMVLAIMRFPVIAWQIAITLTFSHTVIDLMDGFYPEALATNSPFTISFLVIFASTLVVGLLTAYFQRHNHALHTLFLLLIWSTVAVAYSRLALKPDILNLSGISFSEFIFGRFFVDIVFTSSALAISWVSWRLMRESFITK